MITNMACPKCGGQASEYDEHKWACLKCGNKFLFTPPTPSQTYVQNTVNISGQPTFELDVRRFKPPAIKYQKRADYEPNYFDGQCTNNRNAIAALREAIAGDEGQRSGWKWLSGLFGLIPSFCILGLVWLLLIGLLHILIGDFAKHTIELPGDELEGMFGAILIFGAVWLIPLFACRQRMSEFTKQILAAQLQVNTLEQSNGALEIQKQEVVPVGSYLLCPYCESQYVYLERNESVEEGLKHCLRCGKQFFVTQGNSYPVIFQ